VGACQRAGGTGTKEELAANAAREQKERNFEKRLQNGRGFDKLANGASENKRSGSKQIC
jgi:hypothetical protein